MNHPVTTMVGRVLLHVNKNKRARSVTNHIINAGPSSAKGYFEKWIKEAAIQESYRQKLVPEQELQLKFLDALQYLIDNYGAESIGDYFEFGVCHGTSVICMYEALCKQNLDHVRLIGFDSFEGLPESAAVDDDGNWCPGLFKSEFEFTHSNLIKHNVDMDRVDLVKGFYSETLNNNIFNKYKIKKPSIIMIDCDMYLSAKEALTFIAPLIQDRAFIFFDDWDAGQGQLAQKNLGERKAFSEFLNENPDLCSEEFPDLKYLTADPTFQAYSRVFLVARKSS